MLGEVCGLGVFLSLINIHPNPVLLLACPDRFELSQASLKVSHQIATWIRVALNWRPLGARRHAFFKRDHALFDLRGLDCAAIALE